MSHKPTFGFTRHGLPVHARVADHHPGGFNKHVAIGLTAGVGNMKAFWAFNILSLLSLPATLVLVGVFAAPKAGPLHFFLTFGWIYLITWICQNYIQLVLLPALMVGQNLQNEASDARSAKQFEDMEQVKDWLDVKTAGGLKLLLDLLTAVKHDTDLLDEVHRHVTALAPDAGDFPPPPEPEPAPAPAPPMSRKLRRPGGDRM